jgi:hypothetical protein
VLECEESMFVKDIEETLVLPPAANNSCVNSPVILKCLAIYYS